MAHFSPWRRRTYRFLGRLYYGTYWLRHRTFWGFALSTWLLLLFFVLLFAAGLSAWGWRGFGAVLGLGAVVRAAFWVSERAGYNKFVPDEQDDWPARAELRPLPDNQRVKVWATGVFSLLDRENFVLLRNPTQYWRVPLGDHILMVKQAPQRYLYQMFNAATLQKVQRGWFIFGSEPHRALAITFQVIFGPGLDDPTLRYFVGGGLGKSATSSRTIFLSFADEADYLAVWHTILQDFSGDRVQETSNRGM